MKFKMAPAKHSLRLNDNRGTCRKSAQREMDNRKKHEEDMNQTQFVL